MTLSDVRPTASLVLQVVTSTNLHPVIVEVAGFAESFGLCEGMPDQRKQAFTKIFRQGASFNVTEISQRWQCFDADDAET